VTDDLEQTTINPPEPDEGAVEPAPAPNVLASEVQTAQVVPGNGRQRWMIAAGIIGVLVVVSAVAFSLFTGRAADATVLGYVPSDSIMYGEFRMDLPGDQRNAVGEFLSNFPGFADQSTIETKIDEVLDRIVGSATSGNQAFSSDIKPWFGGQVAFSVGALPDPSALESPDAASMADARFLALVSINDAAAATAWFDGLLTDSSISRSSEAYGGTTIYTFSEAGEPHGGYAIADGKVAIAGDIASVKAAIDTKGTGTFADSPEFKAALAATTGDHVGFMYIALRPLIEWSTEVSGDATVGGIGGGALMDLVPEWAGFALRVEGDALRMEALTPSPEGDVPAARTSTVAEHVPSSAIALSVSNDYGQGVLKTLDKYRAEPSLKEVIDGVDQAISVLGGGDAAIGWIGDLGVAVTRTDTGMEGGLVITPTDSAAAGRLFSSLRTLISLGGGGMGIELRDEPYAGTTITIVDLGELSDLAGLAGMAGVSPEMFGTDVPAGRVELAYAVTDSVVILGSGPGFVRSVLDTTPDTSLAQNDRYEALVARVGQGTGSGFVDLTAIRELIEGAMSDADPAERAEYETNVKPFLVPFDALAASNAITGDVSRSTTLVTVK
jgi:hypothetical protein